MALFDPARHEPLAGGAWDEGRARDAIEAVVADAHAAFSPEGLWPIHPADRSDERPPDCLKMLYNGAAGVIWALRRLESAGFTEPRRDYRRAAATLVARSREDLARNPVMAGYIGGDATAFFFGEGGLRFVEYDLVPSRALADHLEAAIASRLGDVRGLVWGAAGAMVGALSLWRRTREARWADLWRAHADALWARWSKDADGWLWTSDLYGQVERRLGALHGMLANVFALWQGRELLVPGRADELAARCVATLQTYALIEDGLANWRRSVESAAAPRATPLVQFCMGAPGVVVTLAGFPREPSIDALLRAAGALVWAAGPPVKPPCLCHGTAGNGYALLRLYGRTGEPLWLERARAFAMHAIAQAEAFATRTGQRKFSLWTGDLGLALFLADCVRREGAFPTLDVF